MVSITPCRERISDRFPLASFVVKVPADRYFEVACATDPRLFAVENREHRNPRNFTTSRLAGLLRAPAGQATYMIPPDTLRNFAGARRLFYAVASYRSAQGQDPIVTMSHDQIDRVPSIQIAPDFTGRSLDRGRLVRDSAPQRYGGGVAAPLSWGGDAVVCAPRLGAPVAMSHGASPARTVPYDDGFDAALWDQDEEDERIEAAAEERRERAHDREDDERFGGRNDLAGYEDGPALVGTASEPDGIEDGAEVWRRFGGSIPVDQAPPAISARPGGALHTPVPRAAPTARRYGDGSDDAPLNCWQLPPDVELVASAMPADDAPELIGGATTRATSRAMPDDGYEDAPDLVRNLGPQLRFGAPRARPSARAFGRFPGFLDGEPPGDALPATRAIAPAIATFDAEDPRQRLRILHRVAVAESGADTYRAVSADREYDDPDLPDFHKRRHVGLSWGFIQFAQRYGSLGQVLQTCHRRDPEAFGRLFGAHNGADDGDLLRITNAAAEDDRLAPVSPPAGGPPLVLWDPTWVKVFQEAGTVRAFQEAQREVADRRYYHPYLDFLAWFGLDSIRAHAMFVDRAIHMGGGAAMQWVAGVIGPIQTQADLAGALRRLGVSDLRTFQSSPPAGAQRWLVADDLFGPRTHAALAWALRRLGDPALRMPALDEMLAALCDDAARRSEGNKSWQLASARLRALKDDPALDRLPPEAQERG